MRVFLGFLRDDDNAVPDVYILVREQAQRLICIFVMEDKRDGKRACEINLLRL